jgi:hypothetical protein
MSLGAVRVDWRKQRTKFLTVKISDNLVKEKGLNAGATVADSPKNT